MKNQNGILSFNHNEVVPAIDAILEPGITESKFGFKVIEKDGELHWEPATEEDYRNSESVRLGIGKSEVVISDCHSTGPRTCEGGCFHGGICQSIYNPGNNYYYCSC